MRAIIRIKIVIIATALVAGTSQAGSFEDRSPYSERNSEYSERNSPYNERNSQYNERNDPDWGDQRRVMRDNDGQAYGYAVPRRDGGVNYYDSDGRQGYSY